MSGRPGAFAPRLVADRYEPLDLLGSGGTGTVWRARDRSSDTLVALKILDRDALESPEAELRFEREARLMQRLASPNIVEVLDYGEESGHAFTVLELVEGETLRDRLRREGRLPVVEAVAIAEQVARGLSAAHARGIVHRDLKPANVLITLDGRVKLADFGIAQTVGEPGVTTDGHVLGSGEYMSPEQAQGHLLDGRSDLYSLGILLFEMIAGRVPFTGIGFADIAAKHVRTPPPSLARFSMDATTSLCDLVASLLEKTPDARPGSTDEVVASLRSIGAEVGREGTELMAAVPPSPEDVLGAQEPAAEAVDEAPPAGTTVLPPASLTAPPAADAAWQDADTDSDWGDEDDTPATGYRPTVAPRGGAGIARYAATLALGVAILAIVAVYVITRGTSSTPGTTAGTTAPPTTAVATTVASSSTAPQSSTSTTAGSANPATLTPVRVVAAQSFDPNGDGTERQDLAKLAFDGDPATAWTTENYRDQPDLTTFKSGVGLDVDFASVRLAGVKVTLTRPGITAAIYVSNETDSPTDLDSWTPATSQKVLTAQTTTITFRKVRRSRHLLIWITKLAPDPKGGYIASVGELQPLEAAAAK